MEHISIRNQFEYESKYISCSVHRSKYKNFLVFSVLSELRLTLASIVKVQKWRMRKILIKCESFFSARTNIFITRAPFRFAEWEASVLVNEIDWFFPINLTNTIDVRIIHWRRATQSACHLHKHRIFLIPKILFHLPWGTIKSRSHNSWLTPEVL